MNAHHALDATSRAQSLAKPLHGIRVLEVGQLVAGPFTGSILAYFGAEVIKIEPPGTYRLVFHNR